ncbi:MAG: nicotinate (nicotinamide) nucleotide adenylyltransferase [Campylobacterota bacterium]
MNLAIFGGSFDPVHIAHEQIVYKAIDSFDIDKLEIVPTYLNPFKSSYDLSPKKRYELLVKTFYANDKIDICDFEIKQNRKVPSIKTVLYLKKLYNPSKIYLIIGEDNLENLDKWYKIDELKELVEFIIVTRPGYNLDINKDFKVLNVNIDISSTKLRDNINLDFIPEKIKEEFK